MNTTIRLLTLLVCLSVPICQANVINGDFAGGLASWVSTGDVSAPPGYARLGDNGQVYSLLYQGVPLATGDYMLDFDFKNALSLTAPGAQTFPDVHFASLYFINDMGQFNLGANQFDLGVPLFDMDSVGVYNNHGAITASPLGPDWLHFALAFTNNHAYAIPTFEFFDLNFIDNDSAVLIDNVRIGVVTRTVPEPASYLLITVGLLSLSLLHRHARHDKLGI